MATFDEDFFRGGTVGLGFALVGGTAIGALYALDVAKDANVPWQALLVHAYTAACIAGAVPMGAMEAARDRRSGPLVRLAALVITGAAVGVFGVTHIATLPDTPYPGPVLATLTLLYCAIGFSTFAQPRSLRIEARLGLSLVPFVLVVPALVTADGLVHETGVLGLERLTVAAYELGLWQLGLVGGALAGVAVGLYVELTVALAKAAATLRARRGSEFAPNR